MPDNDNLDIKEWRKLYKFIITRREGREKEELDFS
jgi:hypothetical protein